MILRKYMRRYKLIRSTLFACVSVFLLVVIKNYLKDGDTVPIVQFGSSCHNVTQNDALLPVDDDFPVPKDSIFFIETSCRGGLTARQACSIESAARAHTTTQIFVFFCGPLTEPALIQISQRNLLNFDNVKFGRIRVEYFSKITPIANMIKQNFIYNRNYSVQNLANVLRYAILHKWGGIYLDTDVIVAKNLKTLGANWAAREADHSVNTAVLALATDKIGNKLTEDILEELQISYRPEKCGWNGPLLLTRVLSKKWCKPINQTEWSAVTCRGFNIYDKQVIYPIHHNNKSIISDRYKQDILESIDVYAYHIMWNNWTFHVNEIPKNSPYGILAQRFCPTIYSFREKVRYPNEYS